MKRKSFFGLVSAVALSLSVFSFGASTSAMLRGKNRSTIISTRDGER